MTYCVRNQSNKVLFVAKKLALCAADIRMRHEVEETGARAVYKIDHVDGTPLSEDERDELWRAQMSG